MMRGNSRLRIALVLLAGLAATSILYAPAAEAKHKKAPTPTPTPMPTPSPTPAPIVKEWNFDQDKAHEIASGWTAVEGDWVVLSDPTAPSVPNGFGMESGRMLKSLMGGLDYSTLAVVTDPAEYSDFTYEAQFKATKGYFDCSVGLIFRYVDPKNYYLLSAGCPSDYFALNLISDGKVDVLKQTVVPIDQGVWYKIKVVTDGDHISGYSNDKMVFDVTDPKIKSGRIGLWAHDDSEPLFDNVTLTLPPGTGEPAPSGAGSSEVPTGANAPLTAPPPMPAAPGAAPPPMPAPESGAPPPMPH
jgi:3-keto-disaccharide hydrolase